jgi:hypothetical protein
VIVAKGLLKKIVDDSSKMDLPTRIRHAMYLKQKNGLDIEHDKRFYRRKNRTKLLSERKRIKKYEDMLLMEAIDAQNALCA